MDENSEKQRRQEEALKLDFETIKHAATLDIATAIVLLTIYRDIGVSTASLVVTLICFFLSLVAAFFCMQSIRNIVANPEAIHSWREGKAVKLLYPGTVVLYLTGLSLFVIFGLGLV